MSDCGVSKVGLEDGGMTGADEATLTGQRSSRSIWERIPIRLRRLRPRTQS